MRIRRLWRTTAFRLVLYYAILFVVLAAATLNFIYYSTKQQIEDLVDARLDVEIDYMVSLYESGAMAELLEQMQRQGQLNNYTRFYDLDTTETVEPQADNEEVPIRLKQVRLRSTQEYGDVVELPPGSSRAFDPVRVVETRLSDGAMLRLGHVTKDEKALLAHTFLLVSLASGTIMLFSIVGAVMIGASVLRRIDSVNQTASDIMSGDLSQRLSVTPRNDEFDEISTKLNQMLSRIEDLMKSMQQVTNNVAHDLRSPLTRMRNRLEVTLLEERDSENYRAVMEEAIGDADSLINTFNAMLSIARLEAGIDSAQWRETAMGDLAEELSELYEAVAEEESELTFISNIRSNPVFHCNRHLIGQAITNLLDNAIKYAPKPSRVELTLSGNDKAFIIEVSDNGPGIPEHERERVLERFVRLENERNSPGNGLGLSLVQAVVRLHSARLVFSDNNPGLKATMYFTAVRRPEEKHLPKKKKTRVSRPSQNEPKKTVKAA